jgi:uncharacterized protein DUF2637
MTANDTATRRVTTGIVLAVGLFAGSDSYSHIYTLARDHGQAIASAALLPLAGDGLIAAASSAMLVAEEEHGDRAARPWLPGTIVERCRPDEWQVYVEDRDVPWCRAGRGLTFRAAYRTVRGACRSIRSASDQSRNAAAEPTRPARSRASRIAS